MTCEWLEIAEKVEGLWKRRRLLRMKREIMHRLMLEMLVLPWAFHQYQHGSYVLKLEMVCSLLVLTILRSMLLLFLLD